MLSVQKVTSRSNEIQKQLIFEIEPGIRLPAVELSPINQDPSATVVFLGRSLDFVPAIPEILSVGLRAVFVDLRGVGEIDSGGGRTDSWAWFMGRPWPSLWVEDINGIIAAISTEYRNAPIGLVGTVRLAKPALFAAALNPGITALIARLPDISYQHEAHNGYLADVPRVLATLDLPAVVALVAPRPCWIQGPQGSDDLELRSTYAWSAEFYQRAVGTPQVLRLGSAGRADWKDTAKWLALHLRRKV